MQTQAENIGLRQITMIAPKLNKQLVYKYDGKNKQSDKTKMPKHNGETEGKSFFKHSFCTRARDRSWPRYKKKKSIKWKRKMCSWLHRPQKPPLSLNCPMAFYQMTNHTNQTDFLLPSKFVMQKNCCPPKAYSKWNFVSIWPLLILLTFRHSTQSVR